MLIIHIFFPLSHENCGCNDNGNNQNVAKPYRSRENPKTIQGNLIKLGK